MKAAKNIQYVSDERRKPTAVIVPIELWQQITADQETAYLLKSETMKQRLLSAKERKDGIDFEVVSNPKEPLLRSISLNSG